MNRIEPAAPQQFNQCQVKQIFNEIGGQPIGIDQIPVGPTLRAVDHQHPDAMKLCNQEPLIQNHLIGQSSRTLISNGFAGTRRQLS